MESHARCPVCGMRTDPDSIALEHRHMRFAFCSEECRERFQSSPDRFIGTSSRDPTPAREEVRRRRLRLGQRLTPSQGETLRELLEGMMGVRAVHSRGDRLEITYDRLQASPDRLEAELAEAGERLGPGWAEPLRRAFIHFEEEVASPERDSPGYL